MKQALLVLVLFLVACSDPSGPEGLPYDVSPFEPPTIYAIWYGEVEVCTGVAGDFDRVGFYVGNHRRALNDPDDERSTVMGRWIPPHDIYLHPSFTNWETIVKHEFVHEILQVYTHDVPGFDECIGALGQ